MSYQAPPGSYQAPPVSYQAPPVNYQAPPPDHGHGHGHVQDRLLNVTPAERQRFVQRKSQLLPWIANPLHLFLHHEGVSEHRHPHHHQSHPQQDSEQRLKAETSLTGAEALYEEVEAEEAHPLELFYDLFFVANLTTITSVHYMTDRQSVISYILFFIILWFTWLQTTLYDIRFTNDSLYERVIRSIHFAVMIGLASVSTSWDPLDPSLPKAGNNLMSMSLTLMASRLALGIQYGVASIYAFRLFKKGILPLMIHTLVMFLAAGAYLGLYFATRPEPGATTNPHPNAYVGWYGIIVIEVAAVMFSSSKWSVVSFKRTHLVERLGLLTLIIIGEGIIVMLKAVNSVAKGSSYGRGWSASIFFIVAAAVAILYLLYMFYFDYTPRGVHYGTIRQQFWAVLHFPFHLSIVLSVEGLRQLATWWSYHQAWKTLNSPFEQPFTSNSAFQYYLAETKTFLTSLYEDGTAKQVVKDWKSIQDQLTTLQGSSYNNKTQGFNTTLYEIQMDVVTGLADYYGIKKPKKKVPKYNVTTTLDYGQFDPEKTVLDGFHIVYTYFFTAMAVVFFMYGILGLFVRRKKDGWDYFSVALRFIVGFTFIGIERIERDTPMWTNFLRSPWPIPTVAIILFVTLLIDKIVGLIAYKSMKAQMFR